MNLLKVCRCWFDLLDYPVKFLQARSYNSICNSNSIIILSFANFVKNNFDCDITLLTICSFFFVKLSGPDLDMLMRLNFTALE